MFINLGNQLINTDHVVRISRTGDAVTLETDTRTHTWPASEQDYEALKKTLGVCHPGEPNRGGKK